MPSVALVPACALIAGAGMGILLARPLPYVAFTLAALWAAAAAGWIARRSAVTVVSVTLGYLLAGVALGAHAAMEALEPAIRTLLDRELGGFAVNAPGPPAPHDPFTIRARLDEDAVPRTRGPSRALAEPYDGTPGPRSVNRRGDVDDEDGSRGSSDPRADVVSVRVQLESIVIRGRRRGVGGGLRLSVAGAAARERAREWRAGRAIEAPVTFRRPARYLNDGVPDFERELALDGIALNASVKSGLLVEVVRRGSTFGEAAADVRALVRARVARWVGARSPRAAGIVTAILIGDRTGLPDEIRMRLQAAGTYHVIAISGGNIAILAAVIAGVLLVTGFTGRASTAAIIASVVAYAAVVSAGPSVWRATATAVAYLAARLIDHRSPPWNAMAVSAALLACVAPLDVRDAGFALTFGATAAIVEAARRVPRPDARARVVAVASSWVLAGVAASLAAEIALLPIAASVFSRVTFAGLVLNLVAVPLMTVAQIAGLIVAAGGGVEWIGGTAGAVAAWAATMLVESARLVEVAPWLALRVPAPSPFVVVLYYGALGAALWAPDGVAPRGLPASAANPRMLARVIAVACAAAILTGAAPRTRAAPAAGRLAITSFDVGQGDALLLQTPAGRAVMVDTGGAGFDGAAFDIGGRVLAPALWARGVRRLDVLAITHADPDHIGGAAAILRDFAPGTLWEGIPVPRHEPQRTLRALARERHIPVVRQRSGAAVVLDDVELRVLHPAAADWERQRVRNDDSLVLEVRYRDVAVLLTGDISHEIERAILPQLTHARVRILKVAHHGSRTSTTRELLDTWKPQIAVISCGRGNTFGHPAPQVLRLLKDSGVRVYRTDRDGQIVVTSDGATADVRAYVHHAEAATAIKQGTHGSHEGHQGNRRRSPPESP